MDIKEKLKYVLEVEMLNVMQFGLVGIVDKSEVKGDRELNDSDNDYFDHKYIDQQCFYDLCTGTEYVPLCDGSNQYFKIEYTD